MNAMHQYLFDAYRATQHRDALPPVPGRHDVAALRSARDARRFARVVAGRPARGRLRAFRRRRPC